VIHTIIMLVFWGIALPIAALIGFPWTFITRDITLFYRMAMWGSWAGVRLAGVRIQTEGLEKIDPTKTYIFMSNHTSNIDPPLLLPLIPRRTSVMAKKELFSYPILGETMKIGQLVPVDRGNRDAGIAAVRAAGEVIRQGVNMTIYVEGKRSFDGKLLPFKKGPFYLAIECGVPIVPVTIVGTHEIMPKAHFNIHPGTARVIFHDPIPPGEFGTRDQLMERVWNVINDALPPSQQGTYPRSDQDRSRETAGVQAN
jgi:1-acyl-sn-glycerol-3-phosphate acyltransferase